MIKVAVNLQLMSILQKLHEHDWPVYMLTLLVDNICNKNVYAWQKNGSFLNIHNQSITHALLI